MEVDTHVRAGVIKTLRETANWTAVDAKMATQPFSGAEARFFFFFFLLLTLKWKTVTRHKSSHKTNIVQRYFPPVFRCQALNAI